MVSAFAEPDAGSKPVTFTKIDGSIDGDDIDMAEISAANGQIESAKGQSKAPTADVLFIADESDDGVQEQIGDNQEDEEDEEEDDDACLLQRGDWPVLMI